MKKATAILAVSLVVMSAVVANISKICDSKAGVRAAGKYNGHEPLEILYDNRTYIFAYPLDHGIERNITVKNTGNSLLVLDAVINVSGTGTNIERLTVFPQWPPLYLDPNEAQIIYVKVEWQEFNRSLWSEGESYEYEASLLLIYQLQDSQPVNTTITLTNEVYVISKAVSFNSAICGYVYDSSTNSPVAGIDVTISTRGRYDTTVTTGQNGFYNAFLYAYKRVAQNAYTEYNVLISAFGYEEYNKAVAPKENETIWMNISLVKPAETANYTLIAKYATPLSTSIGKASENGVYIAIVPFHTVDVTEEYKAENAYLHFFSTNGTLLWRYKLPYETPALDVSDDGSYIATTDGFPHPGLETNSALLLNKTGNLTYNFTPPEISPYPNINLKPRATQVGISHTNLYLAVGCDDGCFFMLNLTTREILWWRFNPPEGQIRYIEFEKDDSRVYVASGDGYLYAFTINGSLAWKSYIGSWAPAMDISNKYIFTGGKVGLFISLIDKENGTVIWRYPVDARPEVALIAPNEDLFVYSASIGDATMGTGFFDKYGNVSFIIQEAGGGAISKDNHILLGGIRDVEDESHVFVRVVNARGHILWSALLDVALYRGCPSYAWLSPDNRKLVVAEGGYVYFFEGGIWDLNLPTPVMLDFPTNITFDSLTLIWTRNTDPDFANYTIYQSTASGVPGNAIKVITTNTTTSWTVTGLSPSTTYYFTVRVYDTSGLYNDSAQVSATTLSAQVVETVGPSGGNVTLEKLTVIIPPNALSENVSFNITTVSVTPPDGYGIVGNVYNIECAVTTFAKPIIITLSYAGITLPENVSEEDLMIYKRADNTWNKLGGTINKLNKTVSVEITVLSEFAIFYKMPIEEEGGEEVKPSEIPWLYIIIPVIIIIVVLVAAGIGINRRKKVAPPTKPA
jgi:hypothetical protein